MLEQLSRLAWQPLRRQDFEGTVLKDNVKTKVPIVPAWGKSFVSSKPGRENFKHVIWQAMSDFPAARLGLHMFLFVFSCCVLLGIMM